MASKYAIESVFSLIDKVSNPLKRIGVNSNAVSRRIQRDFVAAQRRLDRLGKALTKWGKRAVLAATAAATAWVGLGVRNAIKLADTMAIIGSNANITGPPLERLQGRLTDVANQAGVAVNELAGIANTAIGLGVASNAAADFAGVVAKTARVTGAANDTVVAGITNVLAAYGKSADEGNRIAGIMVSANRLGRTSFRELTYSMRYAIPTAASFGVQAEEVFAAVTALTAGGETTRESMQAMGKALNAIRTPGANAAALARHLGINFSEAALQSKGFAGVMDEVRRKTGGDMRAMEMLFGNERTARAMSLLAGSGATAFNDALAEMSKATETVSTEFARVTDTPAQRWQKAINRIQNSGVRLGTALLPVAERIIAKFSDMADRLAGVDFSRFTAKVDRGFRAVERLGGMIASVIGFAWRFRGVIIAIVGAMGLYHGILMGAALVTKTFAIWQGIARGAAFAWTLATRGQAAALAKLKAGTLAYNIAQKAFAIAAKTATAAQWALNTAMKANPIVLIITAVGLLIAGIVLLARNWRRVFNAIRDTVERAATAIRNTINRVTTAIRNMINSVTGAVRNNMEKVLALITIFTGPFGIVISVVRELLNNWHRVVDAFKDGGILGAIKMIGRVLVSGLLAPIQGLLELLSNIPGMENLAGRGAEKIANLRNSLLGEGSSITASTGQIRKAGQNRLEARRDRRAARATEVPQVGYDTTAYERAIRSLETPSADFEFATPNFTMPDLNMGVPRIHGVVDISSGTTASHIPNFSRGNTPGTFTQNQPAAPAVSVQEAIRTAAYGINNTLKEILAVNTAIRTTTLALAALPQQGIDTGRAERERAENDNPRNTPPVTREERITHAIQEHRETLSIEVAAAQGTQARIVRAPKSPNIQLVHSGGNA